MAVLQCLFCLLLAVRSWLSCRCCPGKAILSRACYHSGLSCLSDMACHSCTGWQSGLRWLSESGRLAKSKITRLSCYVCRSVSLLQESAFQFKKNIVLSCLFKKSVNLYEYVITSVGSGKKILLWSSLTRLARKMYVRWRSECKNNWRGAISTRDLLVWCVSVWMWLLIACYKKHLGLRCQ
jgi:hypothetical protein